VPVCLPCRLRVRWQATLRVGIFHARDARQQRTRAEYIRGLSEAEAASSATVRMRTVGEDSYNVSPLPPATVQRRHGGENQRRGDARQRENQSWCTGGRAPAREEEMSQTEGGAAARREPRVAGQRGAAAGAGTGPALLLSGWRVPTCWLPCPRKFWLATTASHARRRACESLQEVRSPRHAQRACRPAREGGTNAGVPILAYAKA